VGHGPSRRLSDAERRSCRNGCAAWHSKNNLSRLLQQLLDASISSALPFGADDYGLRSRLKTEATRHSA